MCRNEQILLTSKQHGNQVVFYIAGAAFSANITGGISTSVAVFCHELPHELGRSFFFKTNANVDLVEVTKLHPTYNLSINISI